MYYMLQKCTTWNIAKVFFEDPELEFSLAEIKRRTELAATSLLLHLKVLLNEGIIKRTKKQAGKRSYPLYTANQTGVKYKHYKKLSNLDSIETSDLVEYIKNNCIPDCIVLFGSYARGEDNKKSDIDLYVQSKEKSILMAKYEKILKRKIQLHFKEDFDKYPKELKNNIINGILLSGFLEAFK